MSLLEFSVIHSYPGGFTLDAHFEVTEGVTGLFGVSGAGKTTILSMIAGMRRPQSGTIRLQNTMLDDASAGLHLPAHRRCIGYVFQEHRLFPHLDVAANLQYGSRPNPRIRADSTATLRTLSLERIMRILDIGKLLDRFPASLSGGECQRVALGRALMTHPKLLMMDEPLVSVDQERSTRILDYLQRIIDEWRIPTIYVSHSVTDMRRFAERVIVVADGRVIEQGPTAETLNRATMKELSGFERAINWLTVDGIHRDANGHLTGRIGPSPIRLPDTMVTMESTALIQFQAADVMLLRHDVSGISARNHLAGTVRQIVALPSRRMLVAIDVGQFLWAEVTPEAVADLELANSGRVMCLIKTSAIRPV